METTIAYGVILGLYGHNLPFLLPGAQVDVLFKKRIPVAKGSPHQKKQARGGRRPRRSKYTPGN